MALRSSMRWTAASLFGVAGRNGHAREWLDLTEAGSDIASWPATSVPEKGQSDNDNDGGVYPQNLQANLDHQSGRAVGGLLRPSDRT